MKIVAVILAGGEGSRIGGDKPRQVLGGVTLLDRAIAYARRLSDRIAIAVREQDLGGPAVPVIRDDPSIEGPLSGLITALRFASGEGADAVMTLPVDMPFLPDDLAERLVDELGSGRATIATSGGHLHPVCGLWLTETLDLVPDYVASGRRSLKGLAEAAGYTAVDWPVEPADPFFNINTPGDLASAEQRIRR